MLRAFVIAVSLAVSALPTTAQPGTRSIPHPRGQLDYYFSRFEAGLKPRPLDGLGARLLWRLARRVGPGSGLPLWAGVYGEHTPRDKGLESWRIGGQTEATLVRPSRLPIEGRISLALGLVQVSRVAPARPRVIPTGGPMFAQQAGDAAASRHDELGVSLAPGLGARLGLGNGAGLRTDLRRIWDFRGSPSAATELIAGVSLPL